MSELGEVTQLVEQLRIAETEVQIQEEKLKTATERVRALKEVSIPNAMEELGYQEVKLGDGSKISIKREVYASITEERRDACLAWLEANGFGGIIKAETTIAFGKGEADRLAKVVEMLTAMKIDHSTKRSVHYQTLRAFIKEQLGVGFDVPLELFGAREVSLAVVSDPVAPKFKLGD